ncbi:MULTISPECIES: SAM-dependent methyltransferase [Haloferax]|uniref:SAM-dependent methyltransferase n=2 Tax=Haloferax TaxID=2251 RepID=A0A6G1Z5C9_9EURY|nr:MULTISPECIES: class I SAM-dependent methyltransferase [Haloferax]KAB1188799.1 class I SAM-dependent methyltransferase [Haloferax sp. CBA1149]MRW81514.1 SAM-dependent methyltransferase [Haloferax marinisediminis]
MTRHDDPFVRYLRSKEAVDDRALHRPTLADLGDRLEEHAESNPGEPLRVVSVGAGTGAMCRRLLSWGVFDAHDDIKYVMVDRRKGMADQAAKEFAKWSHAAGWAAVPTKDGFRIERHGRRVSLTYVTSDLFDAMSALPKAIDLVIAHAVFDLLPLRRAVDSLVSRLVAGGYLYAPITFDGRTAFGPPHDADDDILDAYHETMRDGDSAGPDTGSALLSVLPEFGADIVSAGGSDWVVHPEHDDHERIFLDRILGFVEQSVGDVDSVDDDELKRWLATRHRQLEFGELSYIAHNIDILSQLD